MCKIKRESLGKIYLASILAHKEIHELRDLTMPFNHPTQLCQDKLTIKDVELRISIIISCRLKGVVKP